MTFESFLVPLDGSELSTQVIWLVRRLLLRADAKVELYSAVVPLLESWSERQPDRPDRGQRHAELRLEDARRFLEGVQAQLVAEEGAQVTTEVELGDPADMILRRAERTKPSLVVLGTHGRSGPSRWLRGSVAQRVMRDCRAPLLLINPSAVEADDVQGIGFKTILAPLDGSERASRILPLLREFAALFGSEVVLLRVAPEEEEDAGLTEAAQAQLDRVEQKLEGAGITVRVRKTRGHPAEQILEAIDTEGAHLVALTTHGAGAAERWYSGAVGEKVLRRCAQPLLLLNTRPRDEAAEG